MRVGHWVQFAAVFLLCAYLHGRMLAWRFVVLADGSMALILAQACPDVPGAVIFEQVLSIRPRAWPNLRIVELGDALLGRNGALITAAVEVYRASSPTASTWSRRCVVAGVAAKSTLH